MWCLTATQPCVLSTQRDHVSFPGRFLHLTLDMNDFLESLFAKKQHSLHAQHPGSGNLSSVYRHLRLAVVEWCWWRHSAVVEWWQDKQREKRTCSKNKSLIWMKTGSDICPKICLFFEEEMKRRHSICGDFLFLSSHSEVGKAEAESDFFSLI